MTIALALILLAAFVALIVLVAIARRAGAIPNRKTIDNADGSTTFVDGGSSTSSDCGSSGGDGGGGCD